MLMSAMPALSAAQGRTMSVMSATRFSSSVSVRRTPSTDWPLIAPAKKTIVSASCS
jgi:hypothetical protein